MTKSVLFRCVSLKPRNSYFGFLPLLVLAALIGIGTTSQASGMDRELKTIEIDALAAQHGIDINANATEREANAEKRRLEKQRRQEEGQRFIDTVDRRNEESARTGRTLETPQRRRRLSELQDQGHFTSPMNWQIIHDSGQKKTVSRSAEEGPGLLDRPTQRVQILQRYILDSPNDKAHMEAILGAPIQHPEQIVFAIVEPQYEAREHQIGYGRRARTETSVTPRTSRTKGTFFYVPPDQPNLFFELDLIGTGGTSVFNGIKEGNGYFGVPSFPTGRLPFEINGSELTFGDLRFKRSAEARFNFYNPNDPYAEGRQPKFDLLGEYIQAQVVTLSDQASADDIDLRNRAKQYEFSLYKDTTDDKASGGDNGNNGIRISNLFVMATPIAASEYQLPPLFFRVDLENGQVDQFDVLKRENGWRTAFFNIEGLPGSNGYSSSSVGPFIDARTNGFLGHLNLRPPALRLSAKDIVRPGQWLSSPRDISVVELTPLNGSQLYDASIVLPILLGPLFPYPPQLLTPLFVRWELLDEFGINRTDGIHVGNVKMSVVPRTNEDGGSDGQAVVARKPNGKTMITCLKVIKEASNRRRTSAR